MTIRVVVVDDQDLFRQGLRDVLNAEADIEIVGEAPEGSEALRIIHNTKPNVVLMDLRMPGLDGVETTRRLSKSFPSAKVVILTTFDHDELVFEVLREGAVGYVLKATPADNIVAAVRAAHGGASYISPDVATKVVSEFARLSRMEPRRVENDFGLSQREKQVLKLLARGGSNKEIARALSVATGTVKNHVTNILTKLRVTSRAGAAIKAHEHGLL